MLNEYIGLFHVWRLSKCSHFASVRAGTNLLYAFYIGNLTAPREESSITGADCAPCANSDSNLKEQILKFDDMMLVEDGKNGRPNKTNN
jgi:hypothetical protein